MDRLFGPEFAPNVFVYLDDIIIVSETFEKHIELLQTVFRRLKEAKLTVNISKCEFCKPSLAFLGFVVDKFGLRTNPDKISSITSFQKPTDVTGIKRFLGMAGWYRRFVPNFANLSAPITAIMKGKMKRQSVVWTPQAEDCFNLLKEALISAPVLSSPDFTRTFFIQSDCSDVGIGAALVQGEGADEHPIAYASRTLTSTERNYSVTEREALAVLYGIDKFRSYVEGTHFKVITDHSSLVWLKNLQNPTGRLCRWAVKLQAYDCEVLHRKGKLQVVSDFLSRIPDINSLGVAKNEKRDAWCERMKQLVTDHSEKYPLWIFLE